MESVLTFSKVVKGFFFVLKYTWKADPLKNHSVKLYYINQKILTRLLKDLYFTQQREWF